MNENEIPADVQELNALQYLLTECGPTVVWSKNRKRTHEKDIRAYYTVMGLVRKLRRECEAKHPEVRTLDF